MRTFKWSQAQSGQPRCNKKEVLPSWKSCGLWEMGQVRVLQHWDLEDGAAKKILAVLSPGLQALEHSWRIKLCTSCCFLVAKLSLTVCNTMDCSPPVSSVHGISQARILKRVGCHFLFLGISVIQGLNPHLLHWQADSLLLCLQGRPHVLTVVSNSIHWLLALH